MPTGDPLWMNEEWKADSLKWRGEVLKGKYAHWCHEWDGLPVDETTEEFECCTCFPEPIDPDQDVWDFLDGKGAGAPETK